MICNTVLLSNNPFQCFFSLVGNHATDDDDEALQQIRRTILDESGEKTFKGQSQGYRS